MTTASNDARTEGVRADFSVILHPHRSLSPKAFLILMLFIAGVSFVTGFVFLLMGAWPVVGFFGLDVLLIYLAFKYNYKAGRQCQIVDLTEGNLRVRHITPDGKETRQSFEAYWARAEIEKEKLYILCRQDRVEIGEFLIEDEKNAVKGELDAALYRYRNGAVFT
ncbi:DUF2244 domain-containing protein [Sneathiella sp.]|jgi:uncharacterized membrane protein|uniref:DUF2244 domain-containing protein n=1 Tax=Sneathiella sp. TaxID=1964365 RepID=UPI0039E571A0